MTDFLPQIHRIYPVLDRKSHLRTIVVSLRSSWLPMDGTALVVRIRARFPQPNPCRTSLPEFRSQIFPSCREQGFRQQNCAGSALEPAEEAGEAAAGVD